jgi:hypothetical protein
MIDSNGKLQLTPNLLLAWLEAHGQIDEPLMERVLDFDLGTDEVVVINILDKRAFPTLRSYKAIQRSYDQGECTVCTHDPFEKLNIPEEDISEKQREIRDEIWQEMSPLLADRRTETMLYTFRRGRMIREVREATVRHKPDGTPKMLSKSTMNKRVRRWWQSGRMKNAFLPQLQNCGAPGKKRLATSPQIDEQHRKAGKRSALAITTGRKSTGTGVRMTADIQRRFRLGLKKFYLGEKQSLPQAFESTLQKYFAVDYRIEDGKILPVLPPSDELPTIDQFLYCHEQFRDDEKENRSRLGDTHFELQCRQMLSDPRKMAFAPGSICQIDATILNLYLVSAIDRTRIIGRPVLYNCLDLFSAVMMGYAVLLEGPSWLGAMLALDNVSCDKVEFCAELGIEITEDEWPCKGLPSGILADRGEFEGYNADTLVNSFGISVHNTGVRRPDWKGLVERSFGLSNETLIKFIPGYVPPISYPRANRDYDLKATCTVGELRKLLAYYALNYNTNHYLKDYRFDEYMVANHVPRYPIDLWHWGTRARGGRLSQPSQDIIRLNLLPRKEASITPRGIQLEGDLFYECETALRENWFITARSRRRHRKIDVAFDPRTTERIYLPLENGTRLEVCTRTPASTNLPPMDWHDAMDYFALQRAAVQSSVSRRVQSSAALKAQCEAILAEAKEKTQAALAAAGYPSKRSRRTGIRNNRAAEKELERQGTSWQFGLEGIKETVPSQGEILTNSDYLPSSSKLTRIEALLENQWSNK